MVSSLVFGATGLTPAAALTKCIPPIPPDKYPINVSVTPDTLFIDVSMRVGNYQMDEPICLQVTTCNPGWFMHVQATNLKGPNDEISSDEIYILLKGSAIILNQPKTVVEDSDICTKIILTYFGLHTTQRYKPGTYTGQLIVIAGYPQVIEPQILKIPIKVEVGCTVSSSITGNKMYFHYGLPGENLSATAEGEISTDTDVCLSLTVEKGSVDSLPMVKPFSGEKKYNETQAIPLVWVLRENGTGWREPDAASFHGNTISWELAADSEKIYYELQCNPQPDTAQAPGDYAMRVVLSVVPIL
jgi:hypothetical protein